MLRSWPVRLTGAAIRAYVAFWTTIVLGPEDDSLDGYVSTTTPVRYEDRKTLED